MLVWGLFIVSVIIFLALDLGVFNRTAHVISNKEAGKWTVVWVTLALLFSIIVYLSYQHELISNPDKLKPFEAALKYLTGYLIELSLSVDNIFVIAVIFTSFRIPQKYQHRVLFWGIIGAIVFRALMIFFGVILIKKVSWATYVFGAFLIYTALKMLFGKEERFNPKKSFVYRSLRKIMPITTHIEGEHFFVKRKHLKAATPLFIALIVIEFTDIVFALDSIPAILAITSDPFLVFSSNIMAILGLRSMYFFLSNMLGRFEFLKYSLVAILSFVGIKLILSHHYHFPEWVSISFIAFSLVAGVVASVLHKDESEKV